MNSPSIAVDRISLTVYNQVPLLFYCSLISDITPVLSYVRMGSYNAPSCCLQMHKSPKTYFRSEANQLPHHFPHLNH